jgi:hypothetical protein
MKSKIEQFDEYVDAIENAVPGFDETFVNNTKGFAAQTVAFYTPKLFTPEQKAEADKVL